MTLGIFLVAFVAVGFAAILACAITDQRATMENWTHADNQGNDHAA